ncbi:MAG: HAMP domain-containing sensor histidine kinase [Pseudomonadota bacterium]
MRWPRRVRSKIALTMAATGLITALGVLATMALAFQRFERESTYQRANQFLDRVMMLHDNLFEWQDRDPEQLNTLLSSLVSFEPDSELYLLAADGTLLAASGQVRWPAGVKVRLAPVQLAHELQRTVSYVMGDDPARMDEHAIVAARALQRAVIRPGPSTQGYLYVVCHQPALPAGRWEIFRSSVAGPALGVVVVLIVLGTGLAMWITTAVTRPLRQLTQAVAKVTQEGLQVHAAPSSGPLGVDTTADMPRSHDEWDQLRDGFALMLRTLRAQWDALSRLDHFRREGVSNLSHDLRSPLTATVACLETLERRWADSPVEDMARREDRRLVEVALRNTHNAARLVRSMGELAQLDEPTFQLRLDTFNLNELLDDIALRFADRAAQQGVALRCQPGQPAEPMARVDVELFERAIANLIDNALKFTPAGGHIVLAAQVQPGQPSQVRVSVQDDGAGIADADQPHLFDRFYQSRDSVAPATGEGGKGLGLAIVQRIAELHGGRLTLHSRLGEGTCVSLALPQAVSASVD